MHAKLSSLVQMNLQICKYRNIKISGEKSDENGQI